MRVVRIIAGRLLAAVLPLVACGHAVAVPSFTSGISTGNVANPSVNEASGIAASRSNPNVLWTQNDSGNPAQVFAMTSAGTNLATYSITGASNFDWEDIAVGPGPVAGTQYLYIADIGDNFSIRSNLTIYRVPEPVVSDTQSPVTTSLAGVVPLTLSYPDGARDAESMFVDPLTKDIYIITKRETPKRVYRATYAQYTSGPTAMEFMTSFTSSTWVTSADISPDGNEILVRSAENTSGRLFTRPAGGSITDAFIAGSVSVPLMTEPQGEAIGFDPNGRGYYTTSENVGQPIYYFNRLPAPAAAVYWDNDGTAAGTYTATGAGMGGSGTWDASLKKWYIGGAETAWLDGNDAVFWGTAGTVTLAAGQTVNSLTFKSNGYTLAASTLTLGGPTIAVDPGMTATIGSAVAGSAGLVKSGSGTLGLASDNSYTGGTTISGGTLFVNNTTGSGTGTGAVVVNSGATLGGTGSISGAVTVNSGGHIAPGASIESLDVGSLSLNAGSILDFELDTVLGVDTSDLVNVTGANGLTISGGTLNLTNAGSMTFGTYKLIDYSGTLSGSLSNIALGTKPAGFAYGLLNNSSATSIDLVVTLPGDFDIDTYVNGADFVLWRQVPTYTPADYDTWRGNFGGSASASVVSSTVPEPGAGMFSWLFAALLLMNRRERRPKRRK